MCLPLLLLSQIEVKGNGICELDLFIGRTATPESERRLCARLKRAIERPLEVHILRMHCFCSQLSTVGLVMTDHGAWQVTVTGKGIDAVTTELCVTAPYDAGGHARPRVLLDVTNALRQARQHPYPLERPIAPISSAPVQFALR